MTASVRSELGAAVIGTGFIGAVHVDALRRLGIQVHGVVGSSAGRGAERARAAGLPPAYESMEAMLADERVDVVHVTSPNHLHHAHAKAALEAGKHVVCEKPLAMTSAESADLLELAESSGLVHAVNFNIRFYPINQHLHQLVREGGLGAVRLVTGHYLQDWLLLDTDWNWRLDPALGGTLRAVSDIGSHWFDLTSFLTGSRITSVTADLETFIKVRRQPVGPVETFATEKSGQTIDREIKTEDCATILVRYDNGAMGSLAVSQISAGRKNSLRVEIDGAIGAASWSSELPDELWLGHRGRPNEVLPRDPGLLNAAGAAASFLPGGHIEGFADTFRALYNAVYQAVLEGRPATGRYPTFADGHDEMLVCEGVERSAREGKRVEIRREPIAR
ncbi:MAG TPA: Gfo/Idh/MocA family oxidoreductase [Candidatus Dormibacteraeota bacterium]|nr:Gfo/Idh/MocA family oxidoreductase [Candidatus Dormibacteraeota bacterium]